MNIRFFIDIMIVNESDPEQPDKRNQRGKAVNVRLVALLLISAFIAKI